VVGREHTEIHIPTTSLASSSLSKARRSSAVPVLIRWIIESNAEYDDRPWPVSVRGSWVTFNMAGTMPLSNAASSNESKPMWPIGRESLANLSLIATCSIVDSREREG
jgi:hypothetical protein